MGLVSVFGNDVDGFYSRLLAGDSGVGPIDRFDASKFPTRFAGQIHGFSTEGLIDGKNDRRLDDSLRYCLVSGKKALLSAASPASTRPARVSSWAPAWGGSRSSRTTSRRSSRRATARSPVLRPLHPHQHGRGAAGDGRRVHGPELLDIDGLRHVELLLLRVGEPHQEGRVDLMIAGGTEAAILPIGIGGFVACRALSQRNDDPKTASRPWDKDRDGFVMGEGAGVLVMESLEHAMKRDAPIIAEYLGGAVNCDAYHMTDPRTDGLGVSTCIQKSLEDAGVAPEEVNYINAHATSTLAGDLAEVNAIKQVFKNQSEIKINSTKSMIGHCLGAAGGLEAIATVKAITTGWLHPTINQFNLEPAVEFDTVANEKKQHQVNVAISNSFGFGDTTPWWYLHHLSHDPIPTSTFAHSETLVAIVGQWWCSCSLQSIDNQRLGS
ncbi:3-oxoacyl-[acyl-carrier-protein] synthase I, chloroplastic [Iris pallida]|uniref:3-oxoacyl-[acyl-carrier-protein] synthase n=1 Tax=Iris pallida TaxID=29817 RepID=A0AAX6E8A7_IRIPA|nr:3-oxoacyl-[acyl-carrier-protein] synthase I, chloroplastic [Iris pallida]